MRRRSLALILSISLVAAAGSVCSHFSTASLTAGTTHERTSLPSLFLVCDSKSGSCSLMAMAPQMPSRTSSPAKLLPANSLTPLRMPSRKADRWVPPSLVNWPFTKLKWVSP